MFDYVSAFICMRVYNTRLIFIIKGFQTIVFIFIVISTTFQLICPPAFFRSLSNSGTFTELQTTSFIQCEFWGLINLMFLLDQNYYYYEWYLPVLIFRFFFSSSLLNYRFPYFIQLYTWSSQQVIVAQHMCWFLKASNPPMFSPINYFNLLWVTIQEYLTLVTGYG